MGITETLWTEKYRPQKFSEVKGQEEIVKRVEAFVRQKNLPHLLFAGPAGVGKSTLALVIAKELYGSEWRQNVLELNASDERGIDVVRVKIKDFAKTVAFSNIGFKIIFLDECDALTRDAQQALRRTMENYAATCRFILSCNYASKILEPIQSRCAVFKFKPLTQENVDSILLMIAETEKLTLTPDAKKALHEVSEGDARTIANLLQSCSALDKNITAEHVYSLASTARPEDVRNILMNALKGEFIVARKELLKAMTAYGLSGQDIIKQIQKIIWELQLSNRTKISLMDKLGETEFRMVEGSDEYLQLEAYLANAGLIGEKESNETIK